MYRLLSLAAVVATPCFAFSQYYPPAQPGGPVYGPVIIPGPTYGAGTIIPQAGSTIHPSGGGNVWVHSPTNFGGYTPHGGINTFNSSINSSVFTPGRELGRQMGTTYINQPIWQNGQIVGHQQGHVWTNPHTGQQHQEMQTWTPNGMGGHNMHTNTVMTGGR